MERVLLIRLSALGDVVLVEPAIRALRERFPGVTVDLVTDLRYAPLAARAMGVDAAIPYDRHGEDAGLGGVAQVLGRLPRPRYDAVVDLQGKLRTRALARRVPADRRLTLEKRSPGRALLSLVGRDPPLVDRHTTALYLGALAPLGVEPSTSDPRPRLARPPTPPRAGRTLRIGLSPGATHETKRWPAERFAQLADWCAAERWERGSSAELVLIGGPQDRALLDEIAALARRARFLPLDVARADVEGLAAALAELDLLISVDTGPAHLAAAMGVPVVVLFGPTSPRRWGPLGEPHRVVLRELPCMPCSNTGGPRCPKPGMAQACLRELEVERVAEAARLVLARSPER